MISDWDCLGHARKGDEEAWKMLIRRYNTIIVRIICLITGNMEIARDLAQETFVRLLRSKIRHREGNFKSYLTTIAYRLALKESKKNKRIQDLSDSDFEYDSPTPLEEMILKERNRILFKTINSLDESHRDILVLRFYGEHSYKEIAEIIKLPVGTVKSRIFYAVKTCQQIFEEKGMLK